MISCPGGAGWLAAGMIHTEALDEAAAFILQPIGLRVEAVSE
jgi:hypothetical protein